MFDMMGCGIDMRVARCSGGAMTMPFRSSGKDRSRVELVHVRVPLHLPLAVVLSPECRTTSGVLRGRKILVAEGGR